jgi:hypothetical protein
MPRGARLVRLVAASACRQSECRLVHGARLRGRAPSTNCKQPHRDPACPRGGWDRIGVPQREAGRRCDPLLTARFVGPDLANRQRWLAPAHGMRPELSSNALISGNKITVEQASSFSHSGELNWGQLSTSFPKPSGVLSKADPDFPSLTGGDEQPGARQRPGCFSFSLLRYRNLRCQPLVSISVPAQIFRKQIQACAGHAHRIFKCTLCVPARCSSTGYTDWVHCTSESFSLLPNLLGPICAQIPAESIVERAAKAERE